MPDPEEVRLLARCQQGDEKAFREIVDRYQRRTYWIAHHMLGNYEVSKDISQEAFVRVFKNIRHFDLRKNFYTWLYQIVVNLSIDYFRKRSHHKTADLEEVEEVADAKPDPERAADRTEVQGRVQNVLHRLPPRYKAVLTLRDIQGFSCEEISEIVGCTNATVRWRLHRARKLFKAMWDGEDVEVGEEGEEAREL